MQRLGAIVGKVEEPKKPSRRKDNAPEKNVNKSGGSKKVVKRTDSASSLKHQKSTDSSEAENTLPKTKSAWKGFQRKTLGV